MRYFRSIAFLYTGLLVCAFIFAAATHIVLRNDQTEHMLPGLILFFVCAPLDVLAFYLLTLLPLGFVEAIGWGQMLITAACGAAQAALLIWLARPGTSWLRSA